MIFIFHFIYIYGIIIFPLTNSYFSRWLLYHQPVYIIIPLYPLTTGLHPIMIPSHNWFIATTVTNQTGVFLTHVNVIHQRPRLRRSHNFIPSEISRLDGCCRRTPSWFSVVFRGGTNIYLCAHAFLNEFWCIKNSQKHGGTFKCNAEARVRQKTILVKFSMILQIQNTVRYAGIVGTINRRFHVTQLP